MFSSGVKGSQRRNGIIYHPPPQDKLLLSNKVNDTAKSKQDVKDVYSNSRKLQKVSGIVGLNAKIGAGSCMGGEVTNHATLQDFEDKITIHSIIGFSDPTTHKPPIVIEQKAKFTKATPHHETLQRIECEIDEFNYYQQHWFSPSLEKLKLEDRSREERIEITRHEFLRRLQQMRRSHIGIPNKMPDWIEQRKCKVPVNQEKTEQPQKSSNAVAITSRICEVNECGKPALVCAKYCVMHIIYDSRQVLFEYCTAKFADNTQCSMPVFDISHELPLCAEHARKRDHYRLLHETNKPKKVRKKVKPSAMIRPQKRNKKKKKLPTIPQTKPQPSPDTCSNNSSNSAIITMVGDKMAGELGSSVESPVLEDLQMVDQVLALNENGLEQALATQAHLLEESDITNVLSTIQVDEFSDFFAVNRNGEYEPSREEAEELEKALAAVDNDVKSLEKLSQSHGLLDSFLDDHTLPDSLVQIPEMMFHNGYTTCGDNIVAQSGSFLLPVEPHSHS
ncbi:INO80 complex subunit D-like [Euwallacea fornicatus]|uniref:INO80 complex subunit D-like n=1 Tax=Euwallacea fornicatus TaxID=995702 RepID=UPI00338EE0AD